MMKVAIGFRYRYATGESLLILLLLYCIHLQCAYTHEIIQKSFRLFEKFITPFFFSVFAQTCFWIFALQFATCWQDQIKNQAILDPSTFYIRVCTLFFFGSYNVWFYKQVIQVCQKECISLHTVELCIIKIKSWICSKLLKYVFPWICSLNVVDIA